jgi:hypothetical protein
MTMVVLSAMRRHPRKARERKDNHHQGDFCLPAPNPRDVDAVPGVFLLALYRQAMKCVNQYDLPSNNITGREAKTGTSKAYTCERLKREDNRPKRKRGGDRRSEEFKCDNVTIEKRTHGSTSRLYIEERLNRPPTDSRFSTIRFSVLNRAMEPSWINNWRTWFSNLGAEFSSPRFSTMAL